MKFQVSKIAFFFLLATVVTLPADMSILISRAKLNNFFLVVFLLLSLIEWKQNPSNNRHPLLQFFVISGLFFIYSLFLIQSEYVETAVRELFETKAGLFVLPLIFFLKPRLSLEQTREVLIWFAWSCTLISSYCLLRSWVDLFAIGWFKTYYDLAGYVNMHAIYLAMYLCFAVLIFLWAYFDRWILLTTGVKFLVTSSILLLSITIVLLSARLHIVLLFVIFLSYIVFRFSKKIGLTKTIFFGLIFLLLFTAFVFSVPQNRERFKQAINYQGKYSAATGWGEMQIRGQIWTCAWQLVKQSTILGYGTGNVQEKLNACYSQKGYATLFYFEGSTYNAHNQYLEIWLETGILGLTAFFAIFVFSFLHAVKNENWLHGAFIFLVGISCLTESILERHHGVVFLFLFNCIFFFNGRSFFGNLAVRVS